jgi:diguanylate cyclase (GGDEF)-like protein
MNMKQVCTEAPVKVVGIDPAKRCFLWFGVDGDVREVLGEITMSRLALPLAAQMVLLCTCLLGSWTADAALVPTPAIHEPTLSVQDWLARYRRQADGAPAGCPPAQIPNLSSDTPAKAFPLSGLVPSAPGGPLVVYSQDTIAERLIVLAQGANGCVHTGESGRQLPFGARSIPSPLPNTRIPAQLGETPPVAILADTKVPLPWIRVTNVADFTLLSSLLWLLIGCYIGVMLLLLLVGISFSVWQGGHLARAYVVYLCAMVFYQVDVTGAAFAWLPMWPGAEYARLMHVISTVVVLPSVVVMVLAFLQPKRGARALLIVGASVSSLAFFLSFWSPASYRLGAAGTMMVLVLMLVLLALRLRNGDPAVRWFAAGVAVMTVSGILQPMVVLSSGTEVNAVAAFALPFSSLVEATLWLFALASRFRAERMAMLKRFEYDATHDSLTGTHNRIYLRTAIQSALEQVACDSGRCFGLLFVDLDGFKRINDSLGHAIGDQVLQATAGALTDLKLGHAAMGRYGGDEFLILIDHSNCWPATMGAAAAVIERFKAPLEIAGRSVSIPTSVGVVKISDAYRELDQIVADADIALYVAKANGGGRSVEFKPSMREEADCRANLRDELQVALAQDRIEVHYQPIFDLGSLRPVGFEALVRWRHPSDGLLAPNQFLRLADEIGIGAGIGARVIDKVFATIHQWQRDGLWQHGEYVCINLAGVQLVDERIVDQLNMAFARWPVDPTSIRIELAEALLSTHLDLARKALLRIKGHNVLTAVDDFGTGTSALTAIQDLDLGMIKIDISVIKGVGHLVRSQELVRGILALGKEFGCIVVAEGIETEEQQTVLRQLGCEYGQGFRLAEPLPAAEVAAWIGLWKESVQSISTSDNPRQVH